MRKEQGVRSMKEHSPPSKLVEQNILEYVDCYRKNFLMNCFVLLFILLPSLRLMSLLMSLLSWPMYGGASLCVSHCLQQPTSHACAFCGRCSPIGSADCLQIVCSLGHNTRWIIFLDGPFLLSRLLYNFVNKTNSLFYITVASCT